MPARHTAYPATGIVIGRTNFGEADRVVRFLTPDHGKLSAVAKGVRKIKSRAGGHLELFGEVALMLAPSRSSLETITSARLLWYPHALAGAYEQLGLAFAMAKAIDRLTEPGQPTPGLYELTRGALAALDTGAGGPLIELWLKLRLLQVLGYRPQLEACAVCGRRDADTTYAFSADRGGLVCAADAGALDPPMSIEQIKFWRLLCDHPYATVAHIDQAPALATTTLHLCDTFYEHHLSYSFANTR